MTKLVKSLQITAASGAMLAVSALPAFAANNVWVNISGNGARSRNTATVSIGSGGYEGPMCHFFHHCSSGSSAGVKQESEFEATNVINISTNTGGNTQNGTTQSGAGDHMTRTTTGDVTVGVHVGNFGGSNYFGGWGL